MIYFGSHAYFHEECLKRQRHKRDPGVTPRTYGAVGEKAQVILVWVRAPGVENAFLLWIRSYSFKKIENIVFQLRADCLRPYNPLRIRQTLP